ncbi:MAG TPA: hypothetical protein VHA09_02975 [Nitrososphaera sp.]|nr:hypothetical protein [Nitrososphaera sp.]
MSDTAFGGDSNDDGYGNIDNSSSNCDEDDNNVANDNNDNGDNNNNLSNDHMAAMVGWKARKEQLHRQQKSVDSVNNEAEKVNLISLSKKKNQEDYYN